MLDHFVRLALKRLRPWKTSIMELFAKIVTSYMFHKVPNASRTIHADGDHSDHSDRDHFVQGLNE